MHIDWRSASTAAASPASVEGHDGAVDVARRFAWPHGRYDVPRRTPARRATAREIRRSACDLVAFFEDDVFVSRFWHRWSAGRPHGRRRRRRGLPSSATGSVAGGVPARGPERAARIKIIGLRARLAVGTLGAVPGLVPASPSAEVPGYPSATPGSGSRTSNTASGRPSPTAGPGVWKMVASRADAGWERSRQRRGARPALQSGEGRDRAVPGELGAAAAGRGRAAAARRRRRGAAATAVGGRRATRSIPGTWWEFAVSLRDCWRRAPRRRTSSSTGTRGGARPSLL